MTQHEDDNRIMQRVIALAEKGRATAPPNPWVGCIFVKDKRVIAEGFHQKPGSPHAEAVAIANAEESLEGSTAYVNLEPCFHHGATPPCCEALVRAGVARVVIALQDPDPRTNGEGINYLRSRGIVVTVGVCQKEAERSLRPYLIHRSLHRPYCLMKAAVSFDGRIAAADGSSTWISGAEARADAHRLRSLSQGVAVGVDTALIDNPKLTVRDAPLEGAPPMRIVFDTSGRLTEGALTNTEEAPTLIMTSEQGYEVLRGRFGEALEYCVLPCIEGRVSLPAALKELNSRGVLQLLIEGGGALYTSFVQQQLVDQIALYVGSCYLGDQGRPLLPNFVIPSMEEIGRVTLSGVEALGDTVRIDYEVSSYASE